MDSSIEFWDKTASKYSKRKVSNQEELKAKLKKIQNLLRKDMSVLEVGCGTGTTAIALSEYVTSITANDYSKNMIEIAKNKANSQGVKNITFVRESIDEMSYEQGEFDVAIADNVLHLVEDIEPSLEKIFFALKPGGLLISTTPCTEKVFRYFKYIWLVAYKLKIWPYFSAFSPSYFKDKVEGCGFKILEDSYPNKTDIFLVAQKS